MQRRFGWGITIGVFAAALAAAQAIHGRDGIKLPPPPEVQKIPVTDDYFGTRITDD